MLLSDFSSPWTSPFWDWIFRYSTFGVAILGAFVVLLAFISTWVGYEITSATQLESDQKIAQANERAAQANERANALAVQLEQLRIDQGPRASKANLAWLGGNGGLPSVLKANPTGEALIWYLPNDREAEGFARELWFEIQYSGWKMHGYEQPIPADVPVKEAEEMRRAKEEKIPVFSLVPIDGSTPLLVATNDGQDWNKLPRGPTKTLIDGLLKCGFSVQGGGNNNPLVPANSVLIVVGQKQ